MVFDSDGKKITTFGNGEENAPLVILNTVDNEGECVWENLIGCSLSLAAISGIKWNDDMTPWPSPPVASWDKPCGGKADIYIESLEKRVIPEIIRHCEINPGYIAIAGYSLGGLFALYTAYRTSLFSKIVSASGSFWYPGFSEFILSHEMKVKPEAIYISLGDKEERTRNPMLRTVGEKTRLIAMTLEDDGIKTKLEFNKGNHFQDAPLRIANGIRWILSSEKPCLG